MSEQTPCGPGHTWDGAASVTCSAQASPVEGVAEATLSASDAPTLDANPVPPTFAPPGFEVLAEVGRGGSGRVYKARQFGADRLVALKVLRAGVHASAEDLARFRREARAVARVVHPGVIQIHDVGVHAGQPFLCLEWVEGGSLARRLERGPLAPVEAARLTEGLARAIHHAHGCGVVHRDLSPANVLIGSDGLPKVGDFGLARLLDRGSVLTQTESVLGTPHYLAPEQATGKSRAAGPAADVYALGAVLYAMLTARPPFRAASLAETLRQVRSAAPLPPRRLVGTVPAALEAICLKCLAKDPDQRYPTAAALADDLGHFLRGEAVAAYCPGVRRSVRRWLGAGAAAVVVAALLLTVAGFSRQEAVPPNPSPEVPKLPPEVRPSEPLLSLPARTAPEPPPLAPRPPGVEEIHRLERMMLRQAPGVIRFLKEKYKPRPGEPLLCVGVLKFAVQRGDGEPSDNVGPLNLSLAHRLETALLLTLMEQDRIGLLERPSTVIAAESRRADHRLPAGRKALFALNRFRLAWGTGADATNRAADVFLSGLARLSADLRTLDVTVRAFDRTDPAAEPVDVVAFKAAVDTRTLVETGESFLIARDLVQKRRAGSALATDVEPFVQSRNEILGKTTPHPGTVGESPVTLKVFYGDREMRLRTTSDGRAEVDEPVAKTQVTFRLHNTSTTDRCGVVLLVNGVSTLFEQQLPPEECRKWILDPGETVTVEGFQKTLEKRKQFEVAPVDQALTQFRYGEYVGTFQMIVFLEDKSPQTPPPLPNAEEEREDGVGRAPVIKDKDKRPETLDARQQGVLKGDNVLRISKGVRGLVVAGEQVRGEVVVVPFTFYRDPVMSSVIYYYRPKGQ